MAFSSVRLYLSFLRFDASDTEHKLWPLVFFFFFHSYFFCFGASMQRDGFRADD